MVNEEIRKFWDERAGLGGIAGSNDYLLKNLELDLLRKRIPDKSKVLDVGCGNGQTLITLAQDKNCNGTGIDFSSKMVELAKESAGKAGLNKKLNFIEGSLEQIPNEVGLFDCVITERSLINLDTEEKQYNAFSGIMKHLKNDGKYFMIESCIDGINRTNELRALLGLEPMSPPWHNLFLREDAVAKWANANYILEEVYPFSSTYHLLSRVVYAKLAADKHEELRYDSDINLISCRLPPIGNFGPARLWQWRKKD
jgi:ubiquinone/menaquinone biosynthesis C-methylase UbiE